MQLDPAQVRAQAEYLFPHAKTFDPLGGWHRVVRLANSASRQELRGDALLALDMRCAAEMLLLFCEDLADRGHGPALPAPAPHGPLQDRISVSAAVRGQTLLEFSLLTPPRSSWP